MSLLFILRPVLRLLSFFRLAFVALALAGAATAADAPIVLWPDVAPGDTGDPGEERDTMNGSVLDNAHSRDRHPSGILIASLSVPQPGGGHFE